MADLEQQLQLGDVVAALWYSAMAATGGPSHKALGVAEPARQGTRAGSGIAGWVASPLVAQARKAAHLILPALAVIGRGELRAVLAVPYGRI